MAWRSNHETKKMTTTMMMLGLSVAFLLDDLHGGGGAPEDLAPLLARSVLEVP
jgi:hypothetical protein